MPEIFVKLREGGVVGGVPVPADGRVSWDGPAVTVTALSPEEYLDLDLSDPEPAPDPDPSVRDWAAGLGVAAGGDPTDLT